jgi:hypothetical protein
MAHQHLRRQRWAKIDVFFPHQCDYICNYIILDRYIDPVVGRSSMRPEGRRCTAIGLKPKQQAVNVSNADGQDRSSRHNRSPPSRQTARLSAGGRVRSLSPSPTCATLRIIPEQADISALLKAEILALRILSHAAEESLWRIVVGEKGLPWCKRYPSVLPTQHQPFTGSRIV